jgi:hypothetical protein
MGSIDTASDKVTSIQQSSMQYQSQMFSEVRTALNSLSTLRMIGVSHPINTSGGPDGVSLTQRPGTPGLASPVVAAPDAPAAPDLAEPEIPDVEVPTFSGTAPVLVFPGFDDLELPEAPGAAPMVAEPVLPADPEVELPDVPTFEAVDIPAMPSLITPQFEGMRPVLPDMDTPGRVFVHEEGQFESPLWTALRQRLLEDLQGNGDVAAILETGRVFEQQERWVVAERERRKEEIVAEYSAMGYERLPGEAHERIRLVELDAEKSLEGLLNTIAAKKADLTIQSRQFAVEKSLAAVVGVCLDVFNKGNERALEAAKATAQFAYQDVDARVALFNCQVAAFSAEAAVFEARIRAALADLEAYKTAMEGARIRGELRQQDVSLYLARLQGVGQIVEQYKARLQGASIVADIQKTRIQAFETSVQAYIGQVNAVTAQVNARVARITGEKARAEAFESEVRAFQGQVEAAGAVAKIGEIRANVAGQLNASRVQLFGALTQAFQAEWQGRLGQAEALSRHAANLVALFQADTSGVSAENQAKVQQLVAEVQKWQAQLNASVEVARLDLQQMQAAGDLQGRAAMAVAQVAGQGFAAAGNMVHAAVTLGSSWSDAVSDAKSVSESTSEIKSVSTSTSSNYGESKNYNYNASV